MKNFNEQFAAMRAAADGNWKPSKKLGEPKKVPPPPALEFAPLSRPAKPTNWVAEHEKKQEEAEDRFARLQKEAEFGKKS